MNKLKPLFLILLILITLASVAHAATWSTSKITNNTWANEYPRISIDNKNNIHVVYLQDSSWEQRDMYYKVKLAGSSSWSAPVKLDQNVASNFGLIVRNSISITSFNGKAHIVYTKINDSLDDKGIFYVTNKSGTWSEPVKIFNNDKDDGPEITQESGKLYLVFNRFDGNDFEVYFANNTNGSWSAPERLTNNQYLDTAAGIAVKYGNIHVVMARYVWEGAAGGRSQIRYRSFSNGIWSTAKTAASSSTVSYLPSSIGLFKGKPVIAFIAVGANVGITYPDASGKWIIRVISNENGSEPQIAARGTTGLRVVWEQDNGMLDTEIYYASTDKLAGNWSVSNITNSPAINIDELRYEGDADVALDSHGKSHVVFEAWKTKSLEIVHKKEL